MDRKLGEKMKIYEILNSRDAETGLFYKEWEVPDNFPIMANFTKNAPPEDIQFPKYDFVLEAWIEDVELKDKNSFEELKNKNKELETELSNTKERLIGLEDAFLELMITTTNMKGE